MAKLRIDSRWQRLFDPLDSFRHFAKTIGVAIGIAATFIVGNNTEAFVECGSELG